MPKPCSRTRFSSVHMTREPCPNPGTVLVNGALVCRTHAGHPGTRTPKPVSRRVYGRIALRARIMRLHRFAEELARDPRLVLVRDELDAAAKAALRAWGKCV